MRDLFELKPRIERLTKMIEFGKRRLEVIELQQEHLSRLVSSDQMGLDAIQMQMQQQALQRQKVNTVRLRTKLETKRAVLVTKQTAGERPADATRYVLHPGNVRSQSDGEVHYIGADALVRLYGVRNAKCVVAGLTGFRSRPGDVHLYPRANGDYRLPKKE